MTYTDKIEFPPSTRAVCEQRALLDDIAYCEARLEQMGHLGDCAYERAMTRFYEALVDEKRRSLEDLRRTPPVAAPIRGGPG
ncbi:MAG: hypothetical protein PVF91_01470 [Chromatiales bacterium]